MISDKRIGVDLIKRFFGKEKKMTNQYQTLMF